MKIVKLTAENIKRLKAVEIKPDGSLVTISGKNGAGKSSVLDSISYALGGATLVPGKPIREGETEATVEVELDEIIVTRKFQLRSLSCNCDPAVVGDHNPLCNCLKEPTLHSSLIIKNKDGLKINSPQALLDGLLGKLSFDPLDFARTNRKEQTEILRVLVGIDTTLIDNKRKDVYDQRALLNKQSSDLKAQLDSMSFYEGMPDEEKSIDEISAMMLDAEKKRQQLSDFAGHLSKFKERRIELHGRRDRGLAMIEELENRLKEYKDNLKELDEEIKKADAQVSAAEKKTQKATDELPDIAKIQEEAKKLEEINANVRANKARKVVEIRHLTLSKESDEKSLELIKIDEEKQKLLAKAKFPIKGLGIDHEKNLVTFNGIPFDQASTAEQLKTSVAIGLALNSELKILLVRDGNALDSDSLKAIAEQAAEADAQLWLERVAESKDGIAIMIEDGELK